MRMTDMFIRIVMIMNMVIVVPLFMGVTMRVRIMPMRVMMRMPIPLEQDTQSSGKKRCTNAHHDESRQSPQPGIELFR